MADIDLHDVKIRPKRTAPGVRRPALCRSGRYVRPAAPKAHERGFNVALDATLRAAVLGRTHPAGPGEVRFRVTPADLRKKIFKRPGRTLILFVVDASDSMGQGTFVRMKAAKGAVLALLAKARQNRDRVGLIAFRDASAEVLLNPTSSLTLARRCLQGLPTGGATPFSAGLMQARQLVRTERLKDPEISPLLVIISDGEANAPYDERLKLGQVMEEVFTIARRMRQENISAVAIDTRPRFEKSRDRQQDMQLIAQALGADYHHIDQLRAGRLLNLIGDSLFYR